MAQDLTELKPQLGANDTRRQSVTVRRPVLALQPGTAVEFNGHPAVIERVLDLETVLIAQSGSPALQSVSIESLRPAQTGKINTAPELSTVTPKDWALAKKRLAIIQPFLRTQAKRAAIAAAAKANHRSTATLYEWIQRYTREGRLTALLPRQRGDRGLMRLSAEVEAIIAGVIDTKYLDVQKRRATHIYREIARLCERAGLTPPHSNTVRARIAALRGELKVARREGKAAAVQNFTLSEGSVPGVDAPLAVVQIDHTKLDLFLVDDILRRPIGRPWITVAIDVFSRMVVGFYVAFDPPGALATGLCIAQAILPKRGWLQRLGVEGEWPCWGIMRKLHLDNAKEFHGIMLERACAQYDIEIDWRPVKTPRYGGHIERLLGTFAREIHGLPGTSFSNPKTRGEYDSEGRAALTLSEFERWLTTFIIQVYHARVHSALGVPPIERYRQGIFDKAGGDTARVPSRIVDEERLRLDFMPLVERTVQDYGVMIDWITYSHAVLRSWVGARDPKDNSRKRLLVFRRDPRDISVVWFYDPELQTYFPIPYRDTSRPPISLWELREARRALEQSGAKLIDESAIFAAYERLREIEAQAQLKTKAARRARQRRVPTADRVEREARASRLPPEPLLPKDIAPFDELEDLS